MEEYPLRGVRLKIARARDHLQTLKDTYTAFCDRDPFTVSMRYEDREQSVLIREDSGEERGETAIHEWAVFRFHVRESPPLTLGVIIGDCLQNARAAIEHLAWQLAYPERGGDGPKRGTGFPILDRRPESKWAKHYWRRTVGQIGNPAQEVIECLQPYQRGKDAWLDPLWLVNELARVDRHQVLHVVAATIIGESLSNMPSGTPGGGVYFAPIEVNDELYKFISRTDRRSFMLEDGTEIAGTLSRLPPRGKRRTLRFEAGYFIVFSESEAKGAAGLPVIETLEHILHHIETEALPRFMRFF